LAYFLVLYHFHNTKSKAVDERARGTSFFPKVSVIVPLFNEEIVISKKIQNFEELDYPTSHFEVIFVDGNSQDATRDIITKSSLTSTKQLKLITQDLRNGYTHGVIEGILSSQGEIIVLTDAASYYQTDTIKQLIKHFPNPQVGVVTGKEIVYGEEGAGPQLEQSYRVFYDFLREAETAMDSTPDSKGEILAIRKEICNSLIKKLQLVDTASFDSCIPYEARLLNYKTLYDSDARYYEYAPSSMQELLTQQIRRGTLLVGALLRYKQMLFNSKYGKFGTIIMPAHLMLHCILPWMFLLATISLGILTFLDPIKTLIPWLAVITLLIASKPSRLFFVSFVQSQFALMISLIRLARGRVYESLVIDSISSTRK
jgi:cellulose synthase/poly-beta-1,6-N-acetylglucosamine synthase-like glycosyltransferase